MDDELDELSVTHRRWLLLLLALLLDMIVVMMCETCYDTVYTSRVPDAHMSLVHDGSKRTNVKRA